MLGIIAISFPCNMTVVHVTLAAAFEVTTLIIIAPVATLHTTCTAAVHITLVATFKVTLLVNIVSPVVSRHDFPPFFL
jgi:hypothetical protein